MLFGTPLLVSLVKIPTRPNKPLTVTMKAMTAPTRVAWMGQVLVDCSYHPPPHTHTHTHTHTASFFFGACTIVSSICLLHAVRAPESIATPSNAAARATPLRPYLAIQKKYGTLEFFGFGSSAGHVY